LLLHSARRAASRADWIAGKSKATNTPMMAITTNNSTSVKPKRFRREFIILFSFVQPLANRQPVGLACQSSCTVSSVIERCFQGGNEQWSQSAGFHESFTKRGRKRRKCPSIMVPGEETFGQAGGSVRRPATARSRIFV
jgi:hypothetical protein